MTIYPRAHWYLMLGLVVAIGGFIPSYWSQDLAGFRGIIHIHAGTATLWFLTLIVQPWLVNTGNVRGHRVFGSVALLNALILVGTAAVITPRNLLVRVGNPNLPYMFVYWDVATVCLFAVFVILAMKHRRNVQLHSRYMVATVFVPMLPALARGLFFYGVVENFVSAMYVGNAVTLAAISLLLYDDYKKGRIYAPYLSLYVVFVVLGASLEIVGSAVWWQRLIDAAVVPVVWAVLLGGICGAGLAAVRDRPRAAPMRARAH